MRGGGIVKYPPRVARIGIRNPLNPRVYGKIKNSLMIKALPINLLD